MALHTELDVTIGVYADSTKGTQKFGLSLDSKILNNLVLEASARMKLVASASDEVVSLQSVTNGQLILLKCESEFTVKINGAGNPAITLKPLTNSETSVKTPAFLAMLADGITSLHLGNPSSSEPIEVDVGIAGS